MVQHAAQRVIGVRVLGGRLDRFTDGHAQRTGGIGEALPHGPPGLGAGRRGRGNGGAVGLHLHASVRLGLIAVAHLPDVTGQAEDTARERQRSAPLPGAGLGGQSGDAGQLVVVRLRHRRVRLVAADGGSALVLVVDAGLGAERSFESVGPIHRCGTPQPVDLADFLGDLNPAFGAQFLLDEPWREDGGEVVCLDRLLRARVQVRGSRSGQIGRDVVPVRRDLVLGQQDLRQVVAHGRTLSVEPPDGRWRSTGGSGGARSPRRECPHGPDAWVLEPFVHGEVDPAADGRLLIRSRGPRLEWRR